MSRWLLGCCLPALMLAGPAQAQGQPQNWNRDTYGEIGMLDMPSGHLASDGRLAFTFGDIEAAQRFTLSFQALPWLETAFRYSHVDRVKAFYDRSFSLKARLFNEQDDFADVAVGVRDLLGTGSYGSEYVVASKHFGPFDVSVGAGWGRLADTGALANPFAEIFPSFRQRGGHVDTGGTVNFSQFFHGPRIGVFGGAIWDTPLDGLSLVAEYSSDHYTREISDTPSLFNYRSPINLGAAYKVNDNVALSAGWFYGSAYGFTATFSGDPYANAPSSQRLGPPIPPKTVRSDDQQQLAINTLSRRHGLQTIAWSPTPEERDQQNVQQALFSLGEGVRDVTLHATTLMINARTSTDPKGQCALLAKIAAGAGTSARTVAVTDLEADKSEVTLCQIAPPARRAAPSRDFELRLRKALAQQGLALKAQTANASEVWVYYENGRYQMESEAAGRVVRVLMAEADPSIELFHIFPLIGGMPSQEIDVARSTLERLPDDPGAEEVAQAVFLNAAPLSNPALARAGRALYPAFNWSISPLLSNQFFDPNTPLGFRVLADLNASLQFSEGLSLNGGANATVFNTFNLNRGSDSVLPHVRTDFTRYAKDGANGISYLDVEYLHRLTPEVFTQVRAGYLEDMFAGVGGQILWRPQGSRFALGADLYEVWQRNYDRLFGLQPYHVLTGHMTFYYDSPWYGLNFAVHAGRYLAGDRGATFEVTRRFDSGVEIGAFATFTNVPFSKFGEGSFDKGIIIHIPLEWGTPMFTQSAYDLHLQALNRDGGQRLANDDSLYRITRPTSAGDISRLMTEIAEP